MKNMALISIMVSCIALIGCTSESANQTDILDTGTKGVEQNISDVSAYEIKDDFIKGTVAEIMDGDSLIIDWLKDGEKYNTQFYLEGINAPEIVDPVYEKMPFGDDAKQNLEKLVSVGNEVYIEFAKDDLNLSVLRAFIYIKTDEGVQQLNNEQVKAGLAYVKNADILNQNKYDKLKVTEKQAQDQKLGIWSDDELVKDGEFNRKYIKPGQESLLEQNTK